MDRLKFGLKAEVADAAPQAAAGGVTCAGAGLLDSLLDQSPSTTEGSRQRPEALVVSSEIGAGNRIRTGDPQLGKLMLYQLSYSRVSKGSFCRDPGSESRTSRAAPDRAAGLAGGR